MSRAIRDRIMRPTLARYADLLGRDSTAARALAAYDAIRSTGNRCQIFRTNVAFEVWRHGVREFPLPARRA